MNGINEYNRVTRIEQSTAKINEVLRRNTSGASFETILKEQLNKNESLQFSKHAKERVNQRGIEITDTLLKDLNNAVSKARDKGAKDVVIFDAKNAFIVNIPNNMVITTMAGSELKENVFTNIDSAVII
ncbi:MAG: TIGR02530 family flagellar biosynthesis protein [Anaerovorax sp.]|nr:TIGR02530 family flagellar biosynthesis protein [Anaerovorax sp.]